MIFVQRRDVEMKIGTLEELDVKPGDVVECIESSYHTATGERYTINDHGDILEHTFGKTNSSTFRIISRASDAPKLWRDMTDAEKGALLLAHHEGKVIEYALDCEDGSTKWYFTDFMVPQSGVAYRVRPEPKLETVTLYGCRDRFLGDTHRITFDLIDGKPDVGSVKMDEL